MFEGLETHTDRAMAYYGNDLSPEERAEFEQHLATCAECQALLEKAKQFLPTAERMLAASSKFTPRHTIDEQVARFERMVAEERDSEKQSAVRMRWSLALAAAVLVALAGVAFVVLSRPRPAKDGYTSPTPSLVDGGQR
jgi:anti-sigma factor RsiW